jgi:hypothetical protein
VCGEALDALGAPPSDDETEAGASDDPAKGRKAGGLFIVARGHPELLDQLRVVMGHQSDVHIIEDRRQRPRQDATAEVAREFRKRLREEGSAEED